MTLTDYLIREFPDSIEDGRTTDECATAVIEKLRRERDHWHHQFILRDGHYDKLVERYRAATTAPAERSEG